MILNSLTRFSLSESEGTAALSNPISEKRPTPIGCHGGGGWGGVSLGVSSVKRGVSIDIYDEVF